VPYILFSVAGTTYGVASDRVRHIDMLEHVTPVPNAPPFVDGVVFSRGEVVPVVNLRARFGFERAPHGMRTRLLIVDAGGRRLALLVDEAREFVTVPEGSMQPPGDALVGVSGRYLDAVSTMGERIVLMLNLDRLVEQVGDTDVPATPTRG
jgi:purine-binding chemotaxis protein CheW